MPLVTRQFLPWMRTNVGTRAASVTINSRTHVYLLLFQKVQVKSDDIFKTKSNNYIIYNDSKDLMVMNKESFITITAKN